MRVTAVLGNSSRRGVRRISAGLRYDGCFARQADSRTRPGLRVHARTEEEKKVPEETERIWGFNTRSLHAGYPPDPATHARAVPIYQTTSFVFENSDHAARCSRCRSSATSTPAS